MDQNIHNGTITKEEFDFSQSVIKKLSDYYSNRVVGQEALRNSLIISVVADGHILIESVPGLAKTTAAKAISDAVSGKFSRIQCTPDLLPSDIIGTQIYHQSTGKFETIFGPVFANFVLLDEVNRSSAKTQSAMLEAMQERQVTIGGTTYHMPQDIFIVIATQNPITCVGTQRLPESQLDRFMVRLSLGYPGAEHEVALLKARKSGNPLDKVIPVAGADTLQRMQQEVENIYVSDTLYEYVVALTNATRIHGNVRLGVSPRGSLALLQLAKASAFAQGRDYLLPDDIHFVCEDVFDHRILLHGTSGGAEETGAVVREILKTTPLPWTD